MQYPPYPPLLNRRQRKYKKLFHRPCFLLLDLCQCSPTLPPSLPA